MDANHLLAAAVVEELRRIEMRRVGARTRISKINIGVGPGELGHQLDPVTTVRPTEEVCVERVQLLHQPHERAHLLIDIARLVPVLSENSSEAQCIGITVNASHIIADKMFVVRAS